MTAQEMIDAFLLQYDLNGSGAVAGFTDEEILEFLNKAQFDIVKKVFVEQGPQMFQELVEDLELALVPESATGYRSNTYESFPDFPADYAFYIDSTTRLTRTSFPTITVGSGGDWVANREISINQQYKFKANDSDQVIFYNPVVVVTQNRLLVTVDSYTTVFGDFESDKSCVLKYLRIPTDIALPSTPSELNERWHQAIVDAALLNAMKVTNDARVRGSNNNTQ